MKIRGIAKCLYLASIFCTHFSDVVIMVIMVNVRVWVNFVISGFIEIHKWVLSTYLNISCCLLLYGCIFVVSNFYSVLFHKIFFSALMVVE